jgi:protein-L-isoaspartate(D-aspartate) O-methyltransferase
LNGSVETIPDALFAQLKDGGRLAAVVGSGPAGRAVLHSRVGGTISRRTLFNAAAPLLPGFQTEPRFIF